MLQIILHLIGDFILQPNKMAIEKTENSYIALAHAFIYTSIFTILTLNPLALFIMFITHFLIDRYRLARHIIFIKNKSMEPDMEWQKCQQTGFPNNIPSWLSFMILIVVDNTLHLTINYMCLTYL